MNQQVETELKSLLNSRYSTSESARGNYARGEDTYDPILSKAVVLPEPLLPSKETISPFGISKDLPLRTRITS